MDLKFIQSIMGAAIFCLLAMATGMLLGSLGVEPEQKALMHKNLPEAPKKESWLERNSYWVVPLLWVFAACVVWKIG